MESHINDWIICLEFGVCHGWTKWRLSNLITPINHTRTCLISRIFSCEQLRIWPNHKSHVVLEMLPNKSFHTKEKKKIKIKIAPTVNSIILHHRDSHQYRTASAFWTVYIAPIVDSTILYHYGKVTNVCQRPIIHSCLVTPALRHQSLYCNEKNLQCRWKGDCQRGHRTELWPKCFQLHPMQAK